jgi:hypothetical protein
MTKTYLDLTERGSSPENTFFALHCNEIELGLIERLLNSASGPGADALKQTFIPYRGWNGATNHYLAIQLKRASEIEKQIDSLQEQLKGVMTIIEAIQKTCPHVHRDGTNALVLKTQDSHHNYYQCELCKHEIEE